MSRGLAALDRIVLFVLGLVLLAAGVGIILVFAGVPEATQVAEQIDLTQVPDVTASPWWDVALGITAVLGVILGLWFMLANLGRRGFNKVRSSSTDESGTIDLAVPKIASAIGRSLENHDDVVRVNQRVAMDRSRPTVAWTITADPGIDVVHLRRQIEQSERDFREAVGDMDLDTLYKLHLQPVKTE